MAPPKYRTTHAAANNAATDAVDGSASHHGQPDTSDNHSGSGVNVTMSEAFWTEPEPPGLGDHDVGRRRRGNRVFAFDLAGLRPTAPGLAAQGLVEDAEAEEHASQDEPCPAEHDVPVVLEEAPPKYRTTHAAANNAATDAVDGSASHHGQPDTSDNHSGSGVNVTMSEAFWTEPEPPGLGDHDVGRRRRGNRVFAFDLAGLRPTAPGLAAQGLVEDAEAEEHASQDEPCPAEHDVPVVL
eukprot:CAMPEP_0197945330 /NCGR_PEP_ID=MMETSP1439-20131203/125857_1 /TAXON_ID=66791 /ORGANISM="Gonyaulax spinifera, Strain CCMP409" /LENGTH=239 /DNA_ID=CAMNT_0043568585 /DNA_START=51 /DNA_END=769 /DNA_ORIENTATION=-